MLLSNKRQRLISSLRDLRCLHLRQLFSSYDQITPLIERFTNYVLQTIHRYNPDNRLEGLIIGQMKFQNFSQMLDDNEEVERSSESVFVHCYAKAKTGMSSTSLSSMVY